MSHGLGWLAKPITDDIWSSSEYDNNNAVNVNLNSTNGVYFNNNNKDNNNDVRPVLAFPENYFRRRARKPMRANRRSTATVSGTLNVVGSIVRLRAPLPPAGDCIPFLLQWP